jgi:hypothetical protein
MEIVEILTSATAGFIVSAVIVLTQLAKSYVPERYIPLFGFVLGVLFTLTIFGFRVDVIIPAVLIAGSSLGLYDLAKKSVLGK